MSNSERSFTSALKETFFADQPTATVFAEMKALTPDDKRDLSRYMREAGIDHAPYQEPAHGAAAA